MSLRYKRNRRMKAITTQYKYNKKSSKWKSRIIDQFLSNKRKIKISI